MSPVQARARRVALVIGALLLGACTVSDTKSTDSAATGAAASATPATAQPAPPSTSTPSAMPSGDSTAAGAAAGSSTSASKLRVEVDRGIGVSAKSVGDLRKLTTWPGTLAITTPRERHAESVVRVSKANVAGRVSPKP